MDVFRSCRVGSAFHNQTRPQRSPRAGAVFLGRCMALPMAKWVVTYEPVANRSKAPRPPRLSETFQTEADAKNFAWARLEDSRNVSASTINPHLPKRVIGSLQILDWLEEKP
jgi:hypothetical protein